MFTSRSIALGLTCFALVAPTAGAQDLRMPDTRDAAVEQIQDLRMPDTRDAAIEQIQDLRSPDTRDAANASSGLDTSPMNPPVISTADEPSVAEGSSTPWTTIALVSGGFLLAILLVGLATAVRARRRVAV
ncbi:MAG TPA: hypothetical protein VFZ00_19680 [Solirubrobacter sp.]|jgi:hypothetical protein|nr:hypothetical protein [Solirubrobacter sp.]